MTKAELIQKIKVIVQKIKTSPDTYGNKEHSKAEIIELREAIEGFVSDVSNKEELLSFNSFSEPTDSQTGQGVHSLWIDDSYKRWKNGTLLHIACLTSDIEKVRLLIVLGANLNSKALNDETPLMWAKSKEIAEILIEAGADVLASDTVGRSVPYYLFHKGDMMHPLLDIIVEKGFEVNSQDNHQNTLLMYLLGSDEWSKNIKVIRKLMLLGTDTNIQDRAGNTALLKVFYGKDTSYRKTDFNDYRKLRNVIRLFAGTDCNPSLKNNDGQDALSFIKTRPVKDSQKQKLLELVTEMSSKQKLYHDQVAVSQDSDFSFSF